MKVSDKGNDLSTRFESSQPWVERKGTRIEVEGEREGLSRSTAESNRESGNEKKYMLRVQDSRAVVYKRFRETFYIP